MVLSEMILLILSRRPNSTSELRGNSVDGARGGGYKQPQRVPRKRRKVYTMIKHLLLGGVLLSALAVSAPAQYDGWAHAGALWILTTPEGADLPATAAETNFPLLVRLNQGNFDFAQAKASGADIRFSAEGKPLAFQIEEWDAARGVASIWVRIPAIKGNARQEIKLHWGKADAASASSGQAVFNATNGYVSVMHLGEATDPLLDEVGTIFPTNAGTTVCRGMIGQGRSFTAGTGVFCGKNITTFPAGASPHSTEFWARPLVGHRRIIMWGGRPPLSSVQVLMSGVPYRFQTWTEGSGGGNVNGSNTVALAQWHHVAFTYRDGEPRLYVNGVLDAAARGRNPMALTNPLAMYLGAEWGSFAYCFKGDLDEVRVSRVTRSAD